MQELKDDIKLLKKAVYGDPDNIKDKPGLLHEMRLLMDGVNGVKKLLLAVLVAIISAAFNYIFKA